MTTFEEHESILMRESLVLMNKIVIFKFYNITKIYKNILHLNFYNITKIYKKNLHLIYKIVPTMHIGLNIWVVFIYIIMYIYETLFLTFERKVIRLVINLII